jgi:hypothetical protein
MSKVLVAIVFLLSGIGCQSINTPTVAAERICTPDISWLDIAPKIQSKISKAVYGDISPQGGPFNSTDVIRGSDPQSRFFGACRTGKRLLVAVERGGRGYHLQVFKFYGSAMTDSWQADVPDDGFTPEVLVRSGPR